MSYSYNGTAEDLKQKAEAAKKKLEANKESSPAVEKELEDMLEGIPTVRRVYTPSSPGKWVKTAYDPVAAQAAAKALADKERLDRITKALAAQEELEEKRAQEIYDRHYGESKSISKSAAMWARLEAQARLRGHLTALKAKEALWPEAKCLEAMEWIIRHFGRDMVFSECKLLEQLS